MPKRSPSVADALALDPVIGLGPLWHRTRLGASSGGPTQGLWGTMGGGARELPRGLPGSILYKTTELWAPCFLGLISFNLCHRRGGRVDDAGALTCSFLAQIVVYCASGFRGQRAMTLQAVLPRRGPPPPSRVVALAGLRPGGGEGDSWLGHRSVTPATDHGGEQKQSIHTLWCVQVTTT